MSKPTPIELTRQDTRWVMSTSQGRRWVWGLLSACGVYHDFVGGQDEMMKQIGKRQAGLHLLGLITDASEEQYFMMMREAKNEAEEEQYEQRKRDAADRDNDYTGRGSDAEFRQLDDLIGDFGTYDSGSGPIF